MAKQTRGVTAAQKRVLQNIANYGAIKMGDVFFFINADINADPRPFRGLLKKNLVFLSFSGKYGKDSYKLILNSAGHKVIK